MHLERGPRGGVRGLAAGQLGRGDVRRGLGDGRAVEERAGEFQGGEGVGEPVLHGLEGSDGGAELAALPGVFDAAPQQGQADAEGLGGRQEGGPVGGVRGIRLRERLAG